LAKNSRRFDLIAENQRLSLHVLKLRNGYCSMVEECDTLSDKVMALEFERDALNDLKSTLNERVEYWRKEYRNLQTVHRKLKRIHRKCRSKNIILYR
jgi:hypothetical protein